MALLYNCIFFYILRSEADTNRTWHMAKTEGLINEAFSEHRRRNPTCGGRLVFDLGRERQWGISWKEGLMCTSCSYASRMHKLYQEAESGDGKCHGRGRRSSTANDGIQIGLSKTSIGNEGFRLLMMSADVPPPSVCGMQKSANRIGQSIQELNRTDMRCRRSDVRAVNTYRGHASNYVSISGDACYNNPIYSGGRTPFQGATEVCYVATENQTSDHQVVDLVTRNKLCSRHHVVHNESCVRDVKCSATMEMSACIGNEKMLAKEVILDLKHDNLQVHNITTDADSAAFKAGEELFAVGEIGILPNNFLDTRHLSASHQKFIKRSKFVSEMMPAQTKAKRDNLASKFAVDLSVRCNAEFSVAIQSHAGDLRKLKRGLSCASSAIALCYTGNHSKCRKQSFVCNGGLSNWLTSKASVLSNNTNFKIESTAANLIKLKTCTDFRLGESAIDKTKFNLNTQKCESTNKAIRNSLPKNKTFIHNFPGRAHSAVHSVNAKSSAESVAVLRSKLGCSVTPGTRVARQLKQFHHHTLQAKAKQKSTKSKQARAEKKMELYKLHDMKEASVGRTYSKDMILPGTSKKQ